MLTEQISGRVAVLFHRVGPYHFARLRAVGKAMAATLVEIFKGDEVYDWDLVPGADGFIRCTLFEKHPQPTRRLVRKIQGELDRCHPSVVAIPGWSDAVALSALQWCIQHGVPAILMSESTEWDDPRQWWKEFVKRRLVSMCATGFVGGQPHMEYLARLGIPQNRILQGYDAVDNDHFAQGAKEVRSKKGEVRRKYGLSEKYFLASARFIEKKNLPRLIEAYARYRRSREKSEVRSQKSEPPWDLVLLGDGPLREALSSQLSTLNLHDHVHLPGFKQYEELPAYYGLASAFVHASTVEQWGLVVNEAMASGLPVLVSNRCGCARDLVQEGRNGFTFDPLNVGELAGLMLKISVLNSPLSEFGLQSCKMIAAWGPERFASGLQQAVKAALNNPCPRAGLLDRLLLRLLLMR